MTATWILVEPLLASFTALLVPGLCLAGILLVGALVVALVQRWRKQEESGWLSPGEQLAQYRALYEAGTISEEEYQKLRSLLGGQIRHVAGLTPPPSEKGASRSAESGVSDNGDGTQGIRPA